MFTYKKDNIVYIKNVLAELKSTSPDCSLTWVIFPIISVYFTD